MHSITIVGLGPGAAQQLTLEAHQLLSTTSTLYVRTRIHPTISALPKALSIQAFDHLYEQAADFQSIYTTIAATLIEQAQSQPVVYAVPGHPLVAEATTRHILQQAKAAAVPVQIIAGLSFIEPVCTSLNLDPLAEGMQLLDALDLIPPPVPAASGSDRAWSELHAVGPYPPPTPLPLVPIKPVLLCQVYSRQIAAEVKLSLMERYPASHPVTVVRHAGLPDQVTRTAPLHELDHADDFDHLTCVYLPALSIEQDVRSVDTLQWVMQRLAGPFGCPWDREQTHASLRPFLLEETHEVLEALDAEDWDGVSEELGDLLLQVIFHAELGRQSGTFDLADIATAINTKLIRRHPHIFGDVAVSGAAEVLQNWEAIKATERAEKGKTDRQSLLDGVPASLPALAYAQTIGRKAAKVGFDWPEIAGVWEKINEELHELRAAPATDYAAELGDVLFAVTNLARWLDVDAESALRTTISKFQRRFRSIEAAAAAQGRTVDSLSLEEADALWEAAKRTE